MLADAARLVSDGPSGEGQPACSVSELFRTLCQRAQASGQLLEKKLALPSLRSWLGLPAGHQRHAYRREQAIKAERELKDLLGSDRGGAMGFAQIRLPECKIGLLGGWCAPLVGMDGSSAAAF